MGIQENGKNLSRMIGVLAVISLPIVLLFMRKRRATTAPSAPSQTTSPNAPSQTTTPSVPSQTTSPNAPSQTTVPSASSQTTAPSASSNTTIPDQGTTVESLKLDFSTVKATTNDFAAANEIGKGGFGLVYKGQLPNGQEVVVKRRSLRSNQGKEEFDNETVLAVKFHHKNLVKLIGFSEEGEQKLLIYEFMPNTSLDRFIYDPDKHGALDWETRLKIIKGIAEGLLHLHESLRDSGIHRDLKPSNILLDENLNPKIADFGLAKLLDGDQTHGNTRHRAGTL